jgi:periplasmic copper chaperone A
MLRRTAAGTAVALLVLIGWAQVAAAHVELEPGEAVAGSEATLTFSFHHGKDGTATTALEVQLPTGTTVLQVPPVEGFTSAVDETTRTVRWSGGSVPDGTEARFPILVRLPPDPGVALFPTIQETEAGELAWISPEEGEGEDASPAPRLTLTADPEGTTTTAPTTTTGDAGGSSTSSSLPGTTVEAEQRDDGGTNTAAWLIGSGIAALVAIGVGGLLLKRRADEPGDDAPGGGAGDDGAEP